MLVFKMRDGSEWAGFGNYNAQGGQAGHAIASWVEWSAAINGHYGPAPETIEVDVRHVRNPITGVWVSQPGNNGAAIFVKDIKSVYEDPKL